MDTHEARMRMLDLCLEALHVVERLEKGEVPSADDKGRLRRLVTDSRETLPDAGYPAEAGWRALQRASIGSETGFEHVDPLYWQNVRQELDEAASVLRSLVSPHFRRESDFHIVG
jgi:hypothetical protein